MAPKTRIIILHMKEILYTLVFMVIALVLLFLFIYMLSKGNAAVSTDPEQKSPPYTSDVSPVTFTSVSNPAAETQPVKIF